MGDNSAEEGAGDDDNSGCHLSTYWTPDAVLEAYIPQAVEQNSQRPQYQSLGTQVPTPVLTLTSCVTLG